MNKFIKYSDNKTLFYDEMDIGNIIKNKRLERSLTQAELANKSKVTQSMISKMEKGAAENVSVETLRKLAKALGCSVVDLLPEEDKNPH